MPQPTRDEIASELAYVRALAEEGRDAPLVGGVIYVVWGAVLGVAALVTYLRLADIFDPGPLFHGLGYWVAALAVGWALSFYFGRRADVKPGAMTIGNQTAKTVWLGVGIFMSLFWATLMLFHDNFEPIGIKPFALFGLMFPVAFGVYGIAFLATATAARLNWMRGVAVASWCFSVACFYYLGQAEQMLLAALGSFVCALAPGIALMRREPSVIV